MAVPLLSSRESLVRRASLLRITANSLAESMHNGSFRSLYRGHGIEFDGVREYLAGDDIRTIDWNVTARMDRPFVKQFEEERELSVFLVLDCSLSMCTGRGRRNGARDGGSRGTPSGLETPCTRIETAAETAALLTLASEQNASPVGAVFFDGQIRFSCAPKRGRDQAMLLLSKFDSLEPDGGTEGSVLGTALAGAGKLLRRRSLVFVLSDFRSTGWERPFAMLAVKHDVVAVCIIDEQDEQLGKMGTLPFYDVESGLLRCLPTSSAEFQNAWRTAGRQRLELWKNTCKKRGGYPVVISTADRPDQVLNRFFSSRELSV